MLVIHAISLFWGKMPYCLPGLLTLGCTAWIKSDAFPIWFTTGSLHEINSPNGPDVGHETVQSLVIANIYIYIYIYIYYIYIYVIIMCIYIYIS